jgi:FdhD protein
MARGRTETVLITRRDRRGSARAPDEVIVEEPMEIRLDDALVGTTLRTPGHDFELASGFCFAEGLLGEAVVTGVRYCATGTAVATAFNVVTVDTGDRAPLPTPRLTTATASCGLCGSQTLGDLAARLAPLPAVEPFKPEVLDSVAAAVRRDQVLFQRTGAVHAAAAFTRDGQITLVREDVGRHNAVDKVIGRLMLDGRLPAHDLGLFVSGRAGFELVQKAWAAGFTAMVAVSAPSALAVSTARASGLMLVGFARDGRMNVYAPENEPW